ncbi:hypothetical protein K4749_01075 [Streptomyces sp. TRM72054]|uniref:hypothetical protein n=1 Tax=Streptomyces sp. TRM72054 TaxID=2870562 RepID=UPI001C8B386D|nr:hypothetical protein [Streptomyces sp. TRM72054]MBX9392222.1 hypothetical protein [Streptomyces sp. TRM72054]
MTRQQILALPKLLRIPAQILWPTGLHRPHAALVAQQFVHCPTCKVETAATIHGTALLCTEGHLVSGGGQ